MYKAFFKRLLDIVLSLCGIIVLLPVFIIIAVAIVIDDPGAIFFRQKRVGKNKKLFKILKFRSMKMSTPHDMPTHMLENPEQYGYDPGSFLLLLSLLLSIHIISAISPLSPGVFPRKITFVCIWAQIRYGICSSILCVIDFSRHSY